MARIIWSRAGNPTRGVATTLGITRAQLRDAIHNIKEGTKLGPRDTVRIWDDGAVTDANDEPIGNIYDEIQRRNRYDERRAQFGRRSAGA